MSNQLFMIKRNLKTLIHPPVCHEFKENDISTNLFGANAVLPYGGTCKIIFSSNVCKY